VIIDDHPVARHGLRAMLEPSFDVVASVAEAKSLPRTTTGRVPAHVALVDLYLAGDRPALDVVADLSVDLPVLVVSASRSPADVLAAMQAGASGYETKHATAEAYAAAIEAVAAGDIYLSSQLADLIQAAVDRHPPAPEPAQLSIREREVLSYIARGFTHQQVATRMNVSKSTVNTYIARIRSKLGLGNKAELALAALRYPPVPGRDG
jgi:DNA-binding NarL/FixJ family response regulator